MTTLTTAWMLGCVCGFFMGVTVAGRRQPTCRENTNPPSGPPPLLYQPRSGVYQPRSRGGLTIPPPREP